LSYSFYNANKSKIKQLAMNRVVVELKVRDWTTLCMREVYLG